MSGGGGGGSTPKLLDDNLKSKQYLKVLDLLCEGPIAGPVDQQHLSSFMLNKTPVTDSSGNATINGVSVAWRPGRRRKRQSMASIRSKQRPWLTLTLPGHAAGPHCN